MSPTYYGSGNSHRSCWLRVHGYLIPVFNQIQQERSGKFPIFGQENQMLAVYFNSGRSHMLVRITSQPDKKSLIRHETVCASTGTSQAQPVINFAQSYRGIDELN
jgi:hypothetical protein